MLAVLWNVAPAFHTLHHIFFVVAGWRRDKGEGASAKEEATTAGTCFFQDVMQFLLLKMN